MVVEYNQGNKIKVHQGRKLTLYVGYYFWAFLYIILLLL